MEIIEIFEWFQKKVAQENIVALIEELQEEEMLPAICFNDDRFVCESLAIMYEFKWLSLQEKF